VERGDGDAAARRHFAHREFSGYRSECVLHKNRP
jgi:hypothetical protein